MISLSQIPSLPPPPGVTPNFVDPQSRAWIVLTSGIICLVFIAPISLLRFYVNLWIKSSFKMEDGGYHQPFITFQLTKGSCFCTCDGM